jgi:hypothetical protein
MSRFEYLPQIYTAYILLLLLLKILFQHGNYIKEKTYLHIYILVLPVSRACNLIVSNIYIYQ